MNIKSKINDPKIRINLIKCQIENKYYYRKIIQNKYILDVIIS